MAESMGAVRQELWQVLEAFAHRQQEQEREFLAGGDLDLDLWQGQRQQLFAALQQQLARVVPGVTLTLAEEARLRERIGALLLGERRLAAAAGQRRAELAAQMGRLRRGRVGLGGYGVGASLLSRPRFVSSKG